MQIHVQGIQVNFTYEGHMVKVKVTGTKQREISSCHHSRRLDCSLLGAIGMHYAHLRLGLGLGLGLQLGLVLGLGVG